MRNMWITVNGGERLSVEKKFPVVKVLQNLSPKDRLTALIAILCFLLISAIIGRGLIPQLSQVLGFTIILVLISLLFSLAIFARDKQQTTKYRESIIDDWGFDASMEKKYPSSMVFLEDEVFIRYLQEENSYQILFHKKVLNNGKGPITSLYARIAVSVFPEHPQKAKEYYRANPLEMEELNFRAYDESNSILDYELEFDHDSNKELFIHFRSRGVLYPLYPRETRDIYYEITISAQKWGPFIERNIRTETRECRIAIDFPEKLQMTIWGFEKSVAGGEGPLKHSIETKKEVAFTRYEWINTNPTLYSRYRIRWEFPDGYEALIIEQ